jgi:hypothetical protein
MGLLVTLDAGTYSMTFYPLFDLAKARQFFPLAPNLPRGARQRASWPGLTRALAELSQLTTGIKTGHAYQCGLIRENFNRPIRLSCQFHVYCNPERSSQSLRVTRCLEDTCGLKEDK